MNDRILQDGDHFIDRAILIAGNFSDGASVRLARIKRKSEGLVKNIRRHSIRMSDVAQAHPGTNRLVPVVVPVDGASHCSYNEYRGERNDQRKRQHYRPLSPLEIFHPSPLQCKEDTSSPEHVHPDSTGREGRSELRRILAVRKAGLPPLLVSSLRQPKLKSSGEKPAFLTASWVG